MKVMHIELGRFMYGGARQVQYLLQGLMAYPVQTSLVCVENSEVMQACQAFANVCYPLAMKGDVDLFYIARLRRVIRQEQPDFIHIHSRRGDVLSIIAAWLEKTPIILTRRVDNAEFFLFRRLKYAMIRQVIAISEGIKQALIKDGLLAERILVIRSAIDTSRFQVKKDHTDFYRQYGIRPGQVVIGVVAQLIRRKGHAVLFEGIPDMIKHFPHVRFLIFGQGAEQASLEALCQSLGIADVVQFTGFRKDMENVVPHLDLLVHPAFMEGLGVALLEAAACGVPIVATHVGGIPEIVHDNVNGFLVMPNKTDVLVEAVSQLVASDDLRRCMGDAGLQMIDEFSIITMVAKNFQVYQHLSDQN